MDSLTLIILSMGSAAVVSGVITWAVKILINRNNSGSHMKPQISVEMRDEIEQNERWWTREFHTLLASVGSLSECPCSACWVSNRMFGSEGIRHVQWELGIPADGIVGPVTTNAISSISKGGTTVIYNRPPEMYTGDFALDVQIRKAMKLPVRRHWG